MPILRRRARAQFGGLRTQDVDEVVQRFVLRIRQAKLPDQVRNIRGWLFGSFVRVLIDFQTERLRRPAWARSLDEYAPVGPAPEGLTDFDKQRLLEAMRRLSPAQARAVWLVYFHDATLRTIAKELGLKNRQEADRLLKQTLRKLLAEMDPTGDEPRHPARRRRPETE